MIVYRAPTADMRFVFAELFDGRTLLEASGHSLETLEAVLEAAATFAANVLLPLNVRADREGCTFHEGTVRTPTGFKEAYGDFAAAGWTSLGAPEHYGGQGLPLVVNTLVEEMLFASCMAFGMYPGLTSGACMALDLFGSREQKGRFIPKLVAGTWTGTMCLTEPQAGTDLGLIRTRAEHAGGSAYRITGTKIFISAGEHDLTENIVHLVLARTPDAPAGTRGISMFVVPKWLPAGDGTREARNGVICRSIEHKMGINGCATCTLEFTGATAWLVGELHGGLRAMFTMMNSSRLAAAAQALGLCEAAYQSALAYARERRQGRSLRASADAGADPIIAHPDVRRSLLRMKAWTEGIRMLVVWAAMNRDWAQRGSDAASRREADDRLQILTPIVKAFASDVAFEVTNVAMQVHGGHGYIRDHGIEQLVRDARITQLYEGTNGVQALDLVSRKLGAHDGRYVQALFDPIERLIEEHAADASMQEYTVPLSNAFVHLRQAVGGLISREQTDAHMSAAVATELLRLFALVIVGFLWARTASIALQRRGDAFHEGKLRTARFYMQKQLPEAAALLATILTGSESIMSFPDELFDAGRT